MAIVVSPERLWWARALLVLQRPAAVFAALRDDSPEQAQARQEPLLAVIILAGIAGVLSTTFAGRLLDEEDLDALDVAIWAFVGGAFEGFALYFVVGGLVYLGGTFAGSIWSYRQARHVLGFAAVPLALSLAVWPARLAAYGMDSFREGGADAGAGGSTFEGIEAGALIWTALLVVVGMRTVHAWTWSRTLAAAALPLVVPALALARAYGLA